jgi:hypothetical protein
VRADMLQTAYPFCQSVQRDSPDTFMAASPLQLFCSILSQARTMWRVGTGDHLYHKKRL